MWTDFDHRLTAALGLFRFAGGGASVSRGGREGGGSPLRCLERDGDGADGGGQSARKGKSKSGRGLEAAEGAWLRRPRPSLLFAEPNRAGADFSLPGISFSVANVHVHHRFQGRQGLPVDGTRLGEKETRDFYRFDSPLHRRRR